MSLTVLIESAKNLPNVEKLGKSDPYVSVELQGNEKKTEVKYGDLNPAWNEKLGFDLKGLALTFSDTLNIQVKDYERIGRNRLLGQVKVSLKDVITGDHTSKRAIQLKDGQSRPLPGCVLSVSIHYMSPMSKQSSDASAADTDPSGEGQEDAVHYEENEGEKEEEEVDEVDANGNKVRRKRKKKRQRRGQFRGKLSNKPQEFQIRIKIIEGRQLAGANISPVCRVTVANHSKQTRIKKSTNSPFWNEVFFFNFNVAPAELFDELVNLQVYNSRKLRSDCMIGSFKCDVGIIYDEPQHTFLNKWLLLSDPEDSQAGAKGYMSISACVLAAGDDAPSFKVPPQDDGVDIESNLLTPAGVELRPATFKLKLYRAEDIPRMDSNFIEGVKSFFGGDEERELVDPYFIFSFAGKRVKSKIMYSSDHPEWNQELRIGMKFPSMCERLKLQIRDWDRFTEHDCIVSKFLDLKLISAPGEHGFLPTFGPCYVNLYGSTREYSDLPDEFDDLNLGKGEGVAYRGRALVELITSVGEVPKLNIDNLHSDDIFRVQKFMRRRKYKLHAAFLNATMINEVDAPVEFEVSIGNYGNKLDDSVPPCCSTTQPTNAMFDGCYYYFLPWGNTKPCTVVESHWENISFRLESLNIILAIIDRLEANLEKLRIGQQANLPAPELAQQIIALLEQIIEDCRRHLPAAHPFEHTQNTLDQLLHTYREGQLYFIKKEATRLRQVAMEIDEALAEIDGFLQILKNIAIEPQNSVPDVVIWMISGTKRVAYYRIPAYDVMYSPNAGASGKNCGKLQTLTLKYPGNKTEKDDKCGVPAKLRVMIWLGLEKHEMEWHRMPSEGELSVFAEAYENQVSILGNWTNKGPTMSRPKFSDVTGKMKLDKDMFNPPPGWVWDNDWYISPELSMLFDKDAGHRHFMEDVYENESRIPGGQWRPAYTPCTDVKGDASTGRDDIELPPGWSWDDVWQLDLNRAVDEEGWEYTVEATIGGYGPVEKRYHLCRRRRWARTRTLAADIKTQVEDEELEKNAAEGWEYAPLFNMKFHAKERRMDMVRRRRWHRKIISQDSSKHGACVFEFQNQEAEGKDKEKYDASMSAPRMFLTFTKPHRYQLRAYIYQARDLLAADANGLSDPFARICFLNQSDVTEKIMKTLCPTWDQTLIFEQVAIHGDPDVIAKNPPEIVIELFDHDNFGESEFLGRTVCKPIVKITPDDSRTALLKWHSVARGNQEGGELLASFELFLIDEEKLLFKSANELMNGIDLPFLPPKRGNLYQVPSGIRPIMQRTAIEALCWGVRNMKKFQLANVTSPSVEFEIGGHVMQSRVIKNTKHNPNFTHPVLFFDVLLPKEELNTPPMIIRMRDNRPFGRKPLVGVHVEKSLEQYRCSPIITELPDDAITGTDGVRTAGETIVDMPPEKTQSKGSPVAIRTPCKVHEPGYERLEDEPEIADVTNEILAPPKRETELLDLDIDWWSKFYASTGELSKCRKYLEKGYDKIEVFGTALEQVDGYNDFNDFCSTFEFSRGKNNDDEESNIVGELKATFKVYPLPEDPEAELPPSVLMNLPSSDPEECVVRVYIIKAINLQPNDPNGLADPYVEIKLGCNKGNNRDSYIPNTLDPVFGHMFEMKTMLPMQKDLRIRVMDYDLISSDDIIGETIIDLENRFLTKWNALVGLPKSYCRSGPCAWRDSRKPKALLNEYCEKNHLDPPRYYGNSSLKMRGKVYTLTDYELNKPVHGHLGPADERLALHVLNTLPFVPEHVETRSLFNPLQPKIEQGKLQMFVDVFPQSFGEPGLPIDIAPRKARRYVLRIIVRNTNDVILEEESITGEKMSDIYVKGWIAGIDEKQRTDIHYRSLDGDGNFNWRFVFPFDFLPAEQTMIVRKREHFWSLDEIEQHLAPILMIQIWDNDKFSADDFLGTLELNLNSMPKPAKTCKACSLKQLPDLSDVVKKTKMISLFEKKRLCGFWPCYNEDSGERVLTGKVQMEMELLTEEDAEARPAGQGRDEPNVNPKLEEPKRPETSLLWFSSPLKIMKYILWRNYKWVIIGVIVVLLLVLIIVWFVYAFLGASAEKIVNL